MKINNNNNNFIIKSPKLKSVIVENVLELLYLKDFTISELLSELQRRLHYLSFSYKSLRKYLVYLVDYDLILYDGQRQVYTIEYNGLELLCFLILHPSVIFIHVFLDFPKKVIQ
jgi:hypothetical protein